MTTSGLKTLSALPTLGVGLGFRGALKADTFLAGGLSFPKRPLDWVEITPENYMGKGGQFLDDMERVAQFFPTASHGVSLSIGGADPLNQAYLKELQALFDVIQPCWFSDHLCFSSVEGVYVNDLFPLPRYDSTVYHVADRIKHVQDVIQRPFLIENISFYLDHAEAQLSDAEFTARVLEEADCGLLLDVNNVYVNQCNHGWDGKEYIQSLPLERVVEIHMAGHRVVEGSVERIDTHAEPIEDTVYDLFEWVLRHTTCSPKAVLLERDGNYPPFKDLEVELSRLSKIWMDSGFERPDSIVGLPDGRNKVNAHVV